MFDKSLGFQTAPPGYIHCLFYIEFELAVRNSQILQSDVKIQNSFYVILFIFQTISTSNPMNALRKKEVTEIPEFKLVEYSNGVEGFFDVAGHKVHIRTILAGGYNIQCLHARTLVNIN